MEQHLPSMTKALEKEEKSIFPSDNIWYRDLPVLGLFSKIHLFLKFLVRDDLQLNTFFKLGNLTENKQHTSGIYREDEIRIAWHMNRMKIKWHCSHNFLCKRNKKQSSKYQSTFSVSLWKVRCVLPFSLVLLETDLVAHSPKPSYLGS